MSQVYVIVSISLLSLFYASLGENNLRNNQETQTYIVSIQNNLKPSDFSTVDEWYKSILSKTDSNPSESLLHVYQTVFHGFSARLKPEQANLLRAQAEVIDIFPDEIYQLHTTRTPHFLGLDTYHSPLGLLKDSHLGSNVVVGVLDTGIWPESPSFNDEGMGPVPSHFKGTCNGGVSFPPSLCNKKIVGVRYFISDNETNSARDEVGHGTHTASTIAGRTLSPNCSFFGYAKGEATGIAPNARLSIYKVCAGVACLGSDILAGIDKAVEDGVDVISMSLGGRSQRYASDLLAIGAFGAFQNGVFFSASAGNSGPSPGFLSNLAPWFTTVGASTIDRTFPADVILDNGDVLTGSSLYTGGPLPEDKTFPIVHFASNNSKANCLPDSLDEEDVKGKIVVCLMDMYGGVLGKELVVDKAGGVGTIVALTDPSLGPNDTVIAVPFMTPGLTIPISATRRLLRYIRRREVKAGTLVFRGTRIGDIPAPAVASFSSRGPNTLSKYVLKPDMIAPGVNILAGWPNNLSPTRLDEDPRRSDFNIISGTSMSCPHVSGLAALLKGAHPDWTPGMIRSALMTTAYSGFHEVSKTAQNRNQLSYWETGAGHVNPEKANNPGLTYDISEDDYIQFLCASKYNETEIKTIVKRSVRCDDKTKINEWDLNYPALVVSPGLDGKTMIRTLTSVESTASTYRVKVINPKGVNVTISPLELSFNTKGEKQSFSVKVSVLKDEGLMQNKLGLGSVIWTDGKRHVTIPLMMA